MTLRNIVNSLVSHAAVLGLLVLPFSNVAGGSDTTQERTGCFDRHDLEQYDVDERRQIIFRSKPIIGSYWSDPPDVRVCQGSGVSAARVRRAIEYWQRLGYEFGDVTVESESGYLCMRGGLAGEITIRLPTNETPLGENLALTRNMILTQSREILKSIIYIMPYSASKPLVLEHEIGHALGWRHYNRSYHIMHSTYTRIGHSSTGAAYREYQSEMMRINSRLASDEDQSQDF